MMGLGGWRYIIRLHVKRGEGEINVMTKGKFIKQKDGQIKFKIKGVKTLIPPPDFSLASTSAKGLPMMDISQDGPTEFHQLKLNRVSGEYERVPYAIMDWMISENKLVPGLWTKPNPWSTILPILPVAIAGIISVLMIVIFLDKFNETLALANAMLANQQAVANHFAVAADNMAIAIKNAFPNANVTMLSNFTFGVI